MKKNEEKEVIFFELSDFRYYLQTDKRASKNTVQAYITDLEKYAEFLKQYQGIVDVSEIEREHIEKYILSLKRKDLSTQSISRKIIAIREFHKFLFTEGICKTNPAVHIETPKTSKSLPVVLSIEEITKMIDSIDTSTPIGQRNKAMMETMYASGLRITELLELKLSNIHLREKYMIIIGKGNKERMVPLGDMAVLALRNYIENGRTELSKVKTDILFYNYKGEAMSRQGFYKYIVNLAKENGIEKEISPHTIRHSFATHLLQGGTDIRIVQELLGHEDVSTTQIYTHIDRSQLKDMYDHTHPMAKKNEEE